MYLETPNLLVQSSSHIVTCSISRFTDESVTVAHRAHVQNPLIPMVRKISGSTRGVSAVQQRAIGVRRDTATTVHGSRNNGTTRSQVEDVWREAPRLVDVRTFKFQVLPSSTNVRLEILLIHPLK